MVPCWEKCRDSLPLRGVWGPGRHVRPCASTFSPALSRSSQGVPLLISSLSWGCWGAFFSHVEGDVFALSSDLEGGMTSSELFPVGFFTSAGSRCVLWSVAGVVPSVACLHTKGKASGKVTSSYVRHARLGGWIKESGSGYDRRRAFRPLLTRACYLRENSRVLFFSRVVSNCSSGLTVEFPGSSNRKVQHVRLVWMVMRTYLGAFTCSEWHGAHYPVCSESSFIRCQSSNHLEVHLTLGCTLTRDMYP